jgi:hypothetical protein
MHRLTFTGLALGLAGGVLLASAARVDAQMAGTMSSSGLSGGLGSGGTGSSFGGPGMSGSTGMSGMTGTGTSFSGGMTGTTSTTGGGTGFGGGMAGGRTATYGSSAFWGPYLSAPYAMGLQSPAWGVRAIQHPAPGGEALIFGTALYNTTGTTGFGAGASAGLGSNSQGAFGSSIGVRRSPAFMVEMGSGLAPGAAPASTAGPLQGRPDLQNVLALSSRLSSRDTIRVGMAGPVVVLRGTVLNEHDRRLAENLLRLSPGVHEVRNELVIQGSPGR